MPHRIEVAINDRFEDAAGKAVQHQLADDLGIDVDRVRVIDVYTIDAELDASELEQVRLGLFTDAVIHDSRCDEAIVDRCDFLIEVGYRPGVTDNVGTTATLGIEDMLGRKLGDRKRVYKSTQYAIEGQIDRTTCERAARDLLANELIQRWTILSENELAARGGVEIAVPTVHDSSDAEVKTISLDLDDNGLMALSKDMTLALDLREMQAIRAYYERPDVSETRVTRGLPAAPTDIELEVLAQTWSEHCKHKIFAARIEYEDEQGDRREIDGLFKTYIKGLTDTIAQRVDWLVSVFHDNAGIIRFDSHWNFALKAETHNSPSALDPYGGALTGIVGVNRDILGAGMGCKCVFNTDVFCVASPYYEGTIPDRLLHPKRVLRGVHRGVKDGGNQSGIPDVDGAIVFHDRFLGKPLVFCGTGGLIPRTVNGADSSKKSARPGDHIVMAGGRIGKDGIHGATFSSEALHEGSPSTAVQIGDAITQKKLSDFLLEARDLGLYRNITDNGAGGLSSSVGEMAKSSGGCAIHLDRAPLKYPGLAPWEIFLSEAQERMTFAVPPDRIEAFMALASRREVEATELGTFTDSGAMECYYGGKLVGRLDMAFLHDGVPRMQLRAKLDPAPRRPHVEITDNDLELDFYNVLGALNVCSKEAFVRMYDHEVQGQSVLKQFQGVACDGPGDAAVIRPVADSNRGLAVACGITPKYSDLDTYAMMANAVDETVRNLLCVGAEWGTIAALDNFCWPDPVQSEKTPDGEHKLAQLVRCCEALYDACLAYGIPLISGKDSMKNDYHIGDTKISIPPTVLVTGAAIVPDVREAVSMDVKAPGDLVYLLGETREEMGGSEYLHVRGELGDTPPHVDAEAFALMYRSFSKVMASGVVASCHDCSDGGLGVALAESAFAGGFGIEADITSFDLPCDAVTLFSESAGRLVVTVSPKHRDAFETALAGLPLRLLGEVVAEPVLRIAGRSGVLTMELSKLKEAWQRTLRW